MMCIERIKNVFMERVQRGLEKQHHRLEDRWCYLNELKEKF